MLKEYKIITLLDYTSLARKLKFTINVARCWT